MPNRLAGETSPYLRQHRDNPVDWHPWGEEAFALAAADDRPVLVSIGYSACHWCHVMAHESFEDAATAAVMNELFVNVKVDREERPDVDAIYMDATQAMTGHGGWPMTVFCAPDGRPFYCGTYFPPEPRHGMPSFLDICRAVDDAWHSKRGDLLAQADQVTEALGRTSLLRGGTAAVPGLDVVDRAVAELLREHDDAWGGFGRAPKFPQTMSIDTLLRAHARTGAPEPLAAARTSLDAMAAGGMYDHLGGGFARYSVDAVWLVPHFEKMLYDQALLARAYLHAWQLTSEPAYRQVVEETIGYVLAELRHASGGFFSAEDADSEGEEGRFYVWTPDEVRAAIGDADLAAVAIDWYGVTDDGNFEHGRTILNRINARGELLRPPAVDDARARLHAARARRVRPGLDDKVLAEWNGLMLATLAEAGAALGRDDWLVEARRTGDFLLDALRRNDRAVAEGGVGEAEIGRDREGSADGRWLRSWQADAGAKTLAFAADHGALVDAFTRLAEATGEARWIGAAVDTAEALLGLFWDDDAGGVFTTGHDGERLIARAKDLLDNATPSASSLAAVALLRLGALTGVDRYAQRGEEILGLLGAVAGQHPTAFGHLLYAVELAAGTTEVAIVGHRPDLVAAFRADWRPRAVLAWGEPFESPLWHARDDGRAYVCEHYACQQPATTADELIAQLESSA